MKFVQFLLMVWGITGVVHAENVSVSNVQPGQAPSLARQCETLIRAGRESAAATPCYKVLGLPGARVGDHLRYLRLITQQSVLGAESLRRAQLSLQHLEAQLGPVPNVQILWSLKELKDRLNGALLDKYVNAGRSEGAKQWTELAVWSGLLIALGIAVAWAWARAVSFPQRWNILGYHRYR